MVLGDVENEAVSSETQDFSEQSTIAANFIRAEVLEELAANCMTSEENNKETRYDEYVLQKKPSKLFNPLVFFIC